MPKNNLQTKVVGHVYGIFKHKKDKPHRSTTGRQLLMKLLFLAPILILTLFSCNQESKVSKKFNKEYNSTVQLQKNDTNQDNQFFKKYSLLSLPRKSLVEIGCIFEQELQYKDSIFNCSNKNYVNKSDPCNNTEAYYEGMEIPDSVAQKIHPLIANLSLDFEVGNLREITVTLKDSIKKTDLIEIFHLPSVTNFPENIMDIRLGENIHAKDKPTNDNYTKWFSLTGFDHQGAADVECE